MKLQIALVFALIAFAFALPVPDENESSPIQSAVSDLTAEKKVNVIDDNLKTSATEPKEDEAKPAAAAEPGQPEAKSAPIDDVKEVVNEKVVVAEVVKDDAPVERKLDVVVPAVENVQIIPAVPAKEEQKVADEKPQLRFDATPEVAGLPKETPASDDKVEKKEEQVIVREEARNAPAVPLAEEAAAQLKENTEEIKEDKPESAAQTENLKPEERQIREEQAAEKPAEKPAEKIAEPAEKLAEKPAAKSVEKLEERSAEKPAEKPIEKPAEEAKPEVKAEEPKEKEDNELLRELPIAQAVETKPEQPAEKSAKQQAINSAESGESAEKVEKKKNESSEESAEEKSD